MTNYTVQPGDSLSKIARDVLGDMSLWPEIARINGISNVNLIYPGKVLQLPVDAPEQSVVQKAGFGWGGFLLLILVAGGIYASSKKKKKK